MKRPSFQFYPADWLRDTALRSCSTGARGLWIDMICYMHEGTPYGYLKVNLKVIQPANLARMVGLTIPEVEGYLEELYHSGVYDIDSNGAIYSRRMIKDENLRNIRAAGGKLGGNPNLKDMGKVNLVDNLEIENKVNQNPTPSSSSSSSSSSSDLNPITGETKFPPCPYENLISLWGKHLPHLSQPRSWEGSRKTNMKQRWIQASKKSQYSPDGYSTLSDGIDWWDSFFEYISSDTKLSHGFESAGRTWKPDLEWVMNATNFQKIIDGKYNK